ncbi:transforming growth factor beta like domain protein [Ancylostoma ceylanicum]|uniref:Transforming growth factor beta like domain protein n=1 Tax=Ancylostoma ceylanicum TaxID=53326 RepID=A0A0D6M9F7_9BILA|nr:transforming growth factor beta like domain protein [Ancylostoma ceylanicum]
MSKASGRASIGDLAEQLLTKTKWYAFETFGLKSSEMPRVEVLANNHPLSYFNVFAGAPELDIDYYDSPSQECNPRIECCLVPHYVNFTEIGWNKFIMYPAGFYANYCIGPKHVSCPHEDPEVESILSTARVQSSLPLTRYKCAPRTFAPLNILYSVGPNHSMKLRLDDVRALSCSCMN